MTKTADLAGILRRENDPAILNYADKIDAYLDGQFNSLDAALGIKRGPGIRTPNTMAQYKRRDAAIVAASANYPGTPAEKGRALYSALLLYHQTRLRREKGQMDVPPDRLHFWTILAAFNGEFPGPNRLAQIIRRRK